MNILLVAPFVSLPGEPYFNRFLYLAKLWSKGNCVTLVTSRFSHPLKKRRNLENPAWCDLPFNLVLLDEPGYRTNVSLARVVSHRRFVNRFRDWLKEQEKMWCYDVVYSAFPLIATNLLLGESKERLKFKLVIDVQDVWPESISVVAPILGRHQGLLWPLTRKANRAYGAADGLVAVSATYLKRAQQYSHGKPGLVVYLGADRELVDSIEAIPAPAGIYRLVYLGTLSHSYDVATIVRGVVRMRRRHPELELHILGDGPHRADIEKLGDEGVIFHGMVPYEQMIAFAKGCHLAVNPIVASSRGSVTNKLSDYFVMGLPIINSQCNPEVVALVSRAGGRQYEAGNVESFCEAIEQLITNADMEGIRERTRALGVELFDRTISYPLITSFVSNIWNER